MTVQEAKCEAIKRWGARGFAWESRWDTRGGQTFRVGVWIMGPREKGRGTSFEAAFTEAAAREERRDGN